MSMIRHNAHKWTVYTAKGKRHIGYIKILSDGSYQPQNKDGEPVGKPVDTLSDGWFKLQNKSKPSQNKNPKP